MIYSESAYFHLDKCAIAGDFRPNEWAPLTSMHTMFVRYHNFLAGIFYNKLKQDKSWLSESALDEKTYQETRRVLGAIIQVLYFITAT